MSHDSRFATAVHILAMLALGTDPVSSTAMARSINTNPVSVRRVVGMLRDHGLIETVAGSLGGAVLARPAESVTLRDVYAAIDPTIGFGLHAAQPDPTCTVGRGIQDVLVSAYQKAEHAVAAELGAISIADVVREVTATNL